MINIAIDLDGTVFDLYGKSNWLDLLQNEKRGAFKGNFLSEIDKDRLQNLIGKLLNKNVNIEIVTWLPMNCSKEYERICTKEKIEWCKKNLPLISTIKCVSYGTPKHKVAKQTKIMYLIDDNKTICEDWNTKKQRKALNVNKEFTIVNALEKILMAV